MPSIHSRKTHHLYGPTQTRVADFVQTMDEAAKCLATMNKSLSWDEGTTRVGPNLKDYAISALAYIC